jgi:hypothetical protein
MSPEVCGGKPDENVLDKVRAHYERPPLALLACLSPKAAKTGPPQPLATPPQVFVS